jgi:hypothetical protein
MTITIKFDTTDLSDVVDKLQVLDSQTLREMRESTVEVVSLSVRNAAVAQTVKELNVTQEYVESRLERRPGKREVLLTRDLVVSEVRGTTLQRFGSGVRQETKPTNWSNTDIMQLTRKFGFTGGTIVGPRAQLPNGVYSRIWTKRIGDKSRGIPENEKAAGVSVDVNRKGMKRIGTAFTMPLRNGNGIGVFQRKGGNVKHLYGPSVYQVFRRYAQEKEADIMAELQDTFLLKLDGQLSKI